MASISSWTGYLKISLVSVPLKAYTASSSGNAPIALNQLHEPCNSRINYKKFCPIHGEVTNDEIVSGYEFAKGRYVVIAPNEIEKLRPAGDKSINVEVFVKGDRIDPLYLSGKTYYLLPDGPVGQKPYALLQEIMEKDNLHGIGQVVMAGKEKLVRLRAVEKLIAMDVLQYDAQLKKPSGFEDELAESTASTEELKLTKMLLAAMTTTKLDLASYSDAYNEKLTQLIESKVAGKELVTPTAEATPRVINLMEALKASMKRVQLPADAPEKAKTLPSAKSALAKSAPTELAARSASRRVRKTTSRPRKTG